MFSNISGTQNGIKLANNDTMQATAKGSVDIIANNGGENIPYTLTNTLHVPSLRTNLLSIAKIVDKNLEVVAIQHAPQRSRAQSLTSHSTGGTACERNP